VRDGATPALRITVISTQANTRVPVNDPRLPATEHAVEHVLTLPCFPELTENEIERVCEVLGGL
jgi:dTDP-4-amino-4,6-dideoxygalactose transaminase